MGQKLILVGLVEPKSEADEAAFKDWYLGNHVEDTFHCPVVTGARSFRMVKLKDRVAGPAPSAYLTIYEMAIDDPAEADRLINEYQDNPEASPMRLPSPGAHRIISAGWYLEEVSFGYD